MKQTIRVPLNDSQYVYIEWKGHTTKLREDELGWVVRQASPFVDKVVAAKVKRHSCEHCKRAPDRAMHSLAAEMEKLNGKLLGSF